VIDFSKVIEVRPSRTMRLNAAFITSFSENHLQRHRSIALFAVLLSIALIGPLICSANEIQYVVTVDTTSAAGTSGYIDLQFNPNPAATQSANADVAQFSANGVLDPTNITSGGNVSGTLPGTVTFDNGQTTNEYTEALLFGTTISFHLDLYGDALSNPNGDGGGTFTLDFLDSSGNYLFTADPSSDVPVFTVDVNGDGYTTAATYPSSPSGGPPVVTFSGPASVPEPSTVGLIAGALPVLLALRRVVKK
jgi:hypothetical protein